MTRIAIVSAAALLLLATPSISWAQFTRTELYVAPGEQRTSDGLKTPTYEAGLGFERLLAGGIGADVELGGILLSEADASRRVSGLLGLNGTWHPLTRRNVDPFVLAGYGLVFRTTTTNAATIGLGVQYWFTETRALVVDARMRRTPGDSAAPKYWALRVGLGWR